MGERTGAYRVLVGRPEKDPCIKWIFKKRDGGYGLDSCGSVLGQVAGSCKCSYEPSGSIK
jgi:hypothetical protein